MHTGISFFDDKGLLAINLDWFEKHAFANPSAAFEQWSKWLATQPKRRRNDHTFYKKLLAFATDTTDTSVQNYLGHTHFAENRKTKSMRESLARQYDDLTLALGWPSPPHRADPPALELEQNHVALMLDLQPANLPSLSYHMELIKSLTKGGFRHRINLSLHHYDSNNLEKSIKTTVYSFLPGHLIFIRRNPDGNLLRVLGAVKVPTLFIHAPEKQDGTPYPPPIFGNLAIAYDQTLQQEFRRWLQSVPVQHHEPQIVIAMMKPWDSHRKNLYHFLQQNICAEGLHAPFCEVPDYSFRHAPYVYNQYPNAAAYICMSDALAVGLKNLLENTGQVWQRRILGFDNSPLAEAESLSSFNQGLDTTGEIAMELIQQRRVSKNLAFGTVFKALRLVVRDRVP